MTINLSQEEAEMLSDLLSILVNENDSFDTFPDYEHDRIIMFSQDGSIIEKSPQISWMNFIEKLQDELLYN